MDEPASTKDDDLKEREFTLKLIQAWAEGRNRIATAAAVLNGATLATIVTIIKDKGSVEPYLSPLGYSLVGLFFGILAIATSWQLVDSAIEKLIKGQKEVTTALTHKVVELAFMLFVLASGAGFFLSAGYFIGYTRGDYELSQSAKSPAPKIKDK